MRSWLCGFTMTIGEGSIFQVEAKAMLEGIQLAWDSGYRKVELECDNSLLVKSIIAGGAVVSKMMELRLLHGMLIRPWVVRLCYIPGTQNAMMDCLAEIVNLILLQFTLMEDPSQSIRELLLNDSNLSGLH